MSSFFIIIISQRYKGVLLFIYLFLISVSLCMSADNSMSKASIQEVNERRDGASHHNSRSVLEDQRKDLLSQSSVSDNGRRHQVVKTCSAHTTAVSTVVHR